MTRVLIRPRGAQDGGVDIGQTWNWPSYADQFAEDATHVERALGNMSGRGAIRDWIVPTMNTFGAPICR